MKWSFANVGVLILGIIGILAITFFTDLTVSNEQDYYTLNEAAEAAIMEAVDVAYFRLTGDIKISQEKFVENFTRRFTQTATYGEGNYKIEFYEIQEDPPRINLRIVDDTNSYNIGVNVDPTKVTIVNELSGVLDLYSEDVIKSMLSDKDYRARQEILGDETDNPLNGDPSDSGAGSDPSNPNPKNSTPDNPKQPGLDDPNSPNSDPSKPSSSSNIPKSLDEPIYRKIKGNGDDYSYNGVSFFIYINTGEKSITPMYSSLIYFNNNYYVNKDTSAWWKEYTEIYCEIKEMTSIICAPGDATNYSISRASGEAYEYTYDSQGKRFCYESGFNSYMLTSTDDLYLKDNAYWMFPGHSALKTSQSVFSNYYYSTSGCNIFGRNCKHNILNYRFKDYIFGSQYEETIVGEKNDICS